MKILFLLISIYFFVLPKSCACSCIVIGKTTSESAYNTSEFVFSGSVLAIQEITVRDTAFFNALVAEGIPPEKILSHLVDMPVRQITFKVISNYKNTYTQDTVTILTGLDGASCGFHFELHKKYIVFGYSDDTMYSLSNSKDKLIWTDICTPTKLFSKKENKKLDRLKKRFKSQSR